MFTIIFVVNTFGQNSRSFPLKKLFWTNLEKPNYLDSLQNLGYLKYKERGVVQNMTFFVKHKSVDQYESRLDFYQYDIKWNSRAKKKFKYINNKREYYYLNFAAAIYEGQVILK
ncbi:MULTISPECIES: hypothetical protein [Chryseobacterium]|nr:MULTISPECIES: hypothetical protein [Chryseobacterium]